MIIELERERECVCVVAHQAILRALYGYFTDTPLHVSIYACFFDYNLCPASLEAEVQTENLKEMISTFHSWQIFRP